MFKKISFLLAATAILTACHSKKKLAETNTTRSNSQQVATKTIEKVVEEVKTTSAKINDCGVEITYSNLKPLLSKNCASCHGAYSKSIDFTNYDNFLKYSKNGEIKHHVVEKRDMPPNEMLSPTDMQTIKCWLAGEMRLE